MSDVVKSYDSKARLRRQVTIHGTQSCRNVGVGGNYSLVWCTQTIPSTVGVSSGKDR
jgi:hypothetical protein